MYLNFLDGFGIIENKEMCLRIICERVKGMKIKNLHKLSLEINKKVSRKSASLYDEEYCKVSPSSGQAVYKWVDLGFVDAHGNTLYAQFIRTPDDKYVGCKIGTSDELIHYNHRNPCEKYIPKNEDEKDVEMIESEKQEEVVIIKELEDKEEIKVEREVKVEKVTKEVKNKKSSSKAKNSNDRGSDLSNKRSSISCEKSCNFYKALYDRMLIKDGWNLDEPTLRNYIELIITRLNYLLKTNQSLGRFLIYNNSNSLILFNCGLLDKFGNDIHVITSVMSDDCFSFTDMRLSDGKSYLVANDFSPSSLLTNLVRVDFFDNNADRYFDVNLNQIDTSNFIRIKHCIDERRNRFPDKFKSWTDDALCKDVVKAIEFGLRINKTDKDYIKPMYNMKYNTIHYIIPYHVGGRFSGKPELGIILAQYDDDFWQIMTILEYSECIKNIRSISLYSENSF